MQEDVDYLVNKHSKYARAHSAAVFRGSLVKQPARRAKDLEQFMQDAFRSEDNYAPKISDFSIEKHSLMKKRANFMFKKSQSTSKN